MTDPTTPAGREELRRLCDRPNGGTFTVAAYIAMPSLLDFIDAQQAEIERLHDYLRYIEFNHARAGSPHMDGTCEWRLTGHVARAIRFKEACDAAMQTKGE